MSIFAIEYFVVIYIVLETYAYALEYMWCLWYTYTKTNFPVISSRIVIVFFHMSEF